MQRRVTVQLAWRGRDAIAQVIRELEAPQGASSPRAADAKVSSSVGEG